ncbi:pseudouridine-5'-phosphate glycosidase [Jatrophihabitans endophyticus]|uniref:Pseudouridine-5'-phosphate glycosidase n=1 Tax=Jatrophihabitans endophyticus TaxID=1206085 RepID=A0A1M5C7M1_9ACTN|nr:pseudouridine-5'-phosphate glycosidase [Jatrophihabitans endophyticus]SHF50711.1 pseudouridine-5'-phosphate glycosidase [Jatrophihabitans endophyticus]
MLVHPEVAEALAAHRPVVALESTIISHGLPRPDNLRIAREIEDAVRQEGAVPATIAIVDGQARIGLDDDALARVAGATGAGEVDKVSVRDVAVVAARGGVGATTVASTAHLAARAGIRVFATGGLGGVHREARDTWDESADLTTLSRTAVLVVCAGVKSILDVGATLERLETLNVGVLGYRTERFPGFYLRDSGHPIGWQVDTPADVAAVLRAQDDLGTGGYGLVLANPIAAADELDRDLHDRTLNAGLAAAQAAGVRGKDVTPFLLEFFHRETHGASLAANVALVVANARLAAAVASHYAASHDAASHAPDAAAG